MSLDMNELVVGGINSHRFYIIKGNQLITSIDNRTFENSIGDWSYSGVGVIERIADSDTHFGDYVLKITDDNAAANEYAELTIEFSDDMSERMFILYFWTKGLSSTTRGSIQIVSNSTVNPTVVDSKQIALTEYWKPNYISFIIPSGDDCDELYIRFAPQYYGDAVTSTGIMSVDNINIYEVSNGLTLNAASKFNQGWKRLVDSNYKTIDNMDKEYLDGFKYFAELDWDWLEANEELIKSRIMSSKLVFFVPHYDYNWGLLTKPNGDINRGYLKDKYIGHTGGIKLIGIESLSDDSCQLVETDYSGSDDFESYFYWDDLDSPPDILL